MSIIDEIKQRVDIVEIASEYTGLSKAGKLLSGLCPLHSEKHPSFFIYPEQQRWHCFGACGTGGDVITLVMKKEGLTFGQALRLLAEKSGLNIDTKVNQYQGTGFKDRLYAANLHAAQLYHHLLLNSDTAKKARDYLKERGISQDAIETFYLGYSPAEPDILQRHLIKNGFTPEEIIAAGLVTQAEDGSEGQDRFRGRLIFPIFDPHGRCIAFGGRSLGKSVPKYLNSSDSPIFKKGDVLYALNLAQESIRRTGLVIVVEGYLDAIMAHQYGFSNVVASMGTAITEAQIRELKHFTQNLVLALDSDSAGEEAAMRCLDYEGLMGKEIKMLMLPQGKDPDEVIRESEQTWAELLEKATPIADFLFSKSLSKLDPSSAENKSQLAKDLLPVIGRMKDPIRQAHYLHLMSTQLGISEHRLELALAQYLRSTKTKPLQYGVSDTPAIYTNHGSNVEEECLALLLHYPELRARSNDIPPDYLETSEHREILDAIRRAGASEDIRNYVDSSLWEQVDLLQSKPLLEGVPLAKLNYLLLRLREAYLRRQALQREMILSQTSSLPDETDIAITSDLAAVFEERCNSYGSKDR